MILLFAWRITICIYIRSRLANMRYTPADVRMRHRLMSCLALGSLRHVGWRSWRLDDTSSISTGARIARTLAISGSMVLSYMFQAADLPYVVLLNAENCLSCVRFFSSKYESRKLSISASVSP